MPRWSHLQRHPVAAVFSSQKAFVGPVLGDPRLHRWGLHVARVALADLAAAARRRHATGPSTPAPLRTLRRDGIVVLPRFLQPARFERLRDEVRERVDELARIHPPPTARAPGFGPRQPFEGGFDRYDGGSLNRFVDVDPAHTPIAHAFVRSPRLAALVEGASGERYRPAKIAIQLLRHGNARRHDLQTDLHRDTFHSAIKLWYFLTDVRPEHGPFTYVRGSHRLDLARYRWEHAKAVAHSRPDAPSHGGAFRIREAELPALGLPPPEPLPVEANTLVIADVRGFHRRSPGGAGAERLALHGSFRPSAFLPVMR
ncbi:MAG TPA: phytanoyl-CoA dioxygenase family protein [Sandaracinaceae bacterium LLY-WYZ-13_1]|nr:phytanoyl-CoA dioxygenase family protein [Sandaracinaceae bacterium LLY-WYZ-13_1]